MKKGDFGNVVVAGGNGSLKSSIQYNVQLVNVASKKISENE
jgi:hypothetical protein